MNLNAFNYNQKLDEKNGIKAQWNCFFLLFDHINNQFELNT